MEDEIYYVCDTDFKPHELITFDVDKAIDYAKQLDDIYQRIYVQVFRLDVGKIYGLEFGNGDGFDMSNTDFEQFKNDLINKNMKSVYLWDREEYGYLRDI